MDRFVGGIAGVPVGSVWIYYSVAPEPGRICVDPQTKIKRNENHLDI